MECLQPCASMHNGRPMGSIMTTPKTTKESKLPTPPNEFWESLLVLRNFFLNQHHWELYGPDCLESKGVLDMREAFDTVDCYLHCYVLNQHEMDDDS